MDTLYHFNANEESEEPLCYASNKIPLCLPLISDDFTACIHQAQVQEDVVLVDIPNESLNKQHVRSMTLWQAVSIRELHSLYKWQSGDRIKRSITIYD